MLFEFSLMLLNRRSYSFISLTLWLTFSTSLSLSPSLVSFMYSSI